MFGYSVVGLRVRRADGSGGPLQVDNVDGRGLDLGARWQAFFRSERSDSRRAQPALLAQRGRAALPAAGWLAALDPS